MTANKFWYENWVYCFETNSVYSFSLQSIHLFVPKWPHLLLNSKGLTLQIKTYSAIYQTMLNLGLRNFKPIFQRMHVLSVVIFFSLLMFISLNWYLHFNHASLISFNIWRWKCKGIWDKLFKGRPSKICERQPLKNLKGYGLLKQFLSHKWSLIWTNISSNENKKALSPFYHKKYFY